MAAVIPFPVQRTGDWSESERARLHELAASFLDKSDIEVVFGRSDSGDPWCVVLDAQDEVLVHVARVKGTFVAHTLAGDVFAQAGDLREAVDRALGAKWQEERLDIVVPFAASARQAQLVAAAIVVTSFIYHHRVEASATDEWALADLASAKAGLSIAKARGRDDVAPLAHALDLSGADGLISSMMPKTMSLANADLVQAEAYAVPKDVALASAMNGGAVRSVPAAASQHSPVTPQLEDDARLAEAKVPAPATGDALKQGEAPVPFYELIEGGASDDRLVLDHGAIAYGGDGADSFVVQAPITAGSPALLGVILDYEVDVDSVVAVGELPLRVVSITSVQNIFADPNVHLAGAPAVAGERIGLDFDGDSREDGYLLAGTSKVDPAMIEAVKAAIGQAHVQDASGAFMPDPRPEQGNIVHAAPAEPMMIAPPTDLI